MFTSFNIHSIRFFARTKDEWGLECMANCGNSFFTQNLINGFLLLFTFLEETRNMCEHNKEGLSRVLPHTQMSNFCRWNAESSLCCLYWGDSEKSRIFGCTKGNDTYTTGMPGVDAWDGDEVGSHCCINYLLHRSMLNAQRHKIILNHSSLDFNSFYFPFEFVARLFFSGIDLHLPRSKNVPWKKFNVILKRTGGCDDESMTVKWGRRTKNSATNI